MKTKVMSVTELSGSFKKDLKHLDGLTSDQWNILSDWLSLQKHVLDTGVREVELLDLSKKTDLPADKLGPVLRSIFFTRRMLSVHGDKGNDLVADFVTDQLISHETSVSLGRLIETVLLEASPSLDAQTAYELVLPVFQDARTRCLLLPRFDKEYELSDTPENYSCKVSSLFPSVVVHLNLDGPGDEKSHSFILSEKGLDDLLNRLRFAQKQLDTLKAHLTIK